MVFVRNSGPGKLNLRFGVKLAPGQVTQVPDPAWAECKADKITRHYLSTGQIQVVAGSGPPKSTALPRAADPATRILPVAPPKPARPPVSNNIPEVEPPGEQEQDTEELPVPDIEEEHDTSQVVQLGGESLKMKARDLIVLINASTEVGVLKELLTTESRPTVRAAIERRLEELREASG